MGTGSLQVGTFRGAGELARVGTFRDPSESLVRSDLQAGTFQSEDGTFWPWDTSDGPEGRLGTDQHTQSSLWVTDQSKAPDECRAGRPVAEATREWA